MSNLPAPTSTLPGFAYHFGGAQPPSLVSFGDKTVLSAGKNALLLVIGEASTRGTENTMLQPLSPYASLSGVDVHRGKKLWQF